LELLQKAWEAIVKFFQVDTIVKIGSLLLAILLWLYVVTANMYVYQIDLPLRIVNVPEGKTIANEVPQVVQARFRGTGITYLKTMITRSYFDMSLRLNAGGIDETFIYYLQDYIEENPDNILLPRGLNLELVNIVQPELIRVELDDLVVKTVPVFKDIQVTAASGYTLVGSVRIDPDSIGIQGPAEELNTIDSVRTEEIRITGADGFIERTANVIIQSPQVVETTTGEVTYYADVQTISERNLTDVPVEVRNVPERLSASTAPSSVSLTIEGGSQYIYNLSQADIQIYVDYAEQWNPQQDYFVPQIETPPDVLRWRNLNPNRVELIIVRR